jgi:hypothetical protein
LVRKPAVTGGVNYQNNFACVLAQVLRGFILKPLEGFLQN